MKINTKSLQKANVLQFLSQFVLVIVTGILLLISYNCLINSFKDNQQKQINYYINQNEKIDQVLSNPSSLTQESIKSYDAKNNTNFNLSLENSKMQRTMSFQDHTISNNPINKIVNAKIVEPLLQLKSKNLSKVSEIEGDRNNFWGSLPPFSALLFGALGVFFTTIIANFARSCYQGISALFPRFQKADLK